MIKYGFMMNITNRFSASDKLFIIEDDIFSSLFPEKYREYIDCHIWEERGQIWVKFRTWTEEIALEYPHLFSIVPEGDIFPLVS